MKNLKVSWVRGLQLLVTACVSGKFRSRFGVCDGLVTELDDVAGAILPTRQLQGMRDLRHEAPPKSAGIRGATQSTSHDRTEAPNSDQPDEALMVHGPQPSNGHRKPQLQKPAARNPG